MHEVFRRLFVALMALMAVGVLLFCLMWGGAFFLAGLGLTPYSATLSFTERVQHLIGGLAIVVIPTAVITYAALGYRKSS